jgi:hypothetical protein
MALSFTAGITPYLTIWTEPRATIRRIVDTDPERSVIALASIAPVLATLEREWMSAMSGPQPDWWPIKVLFEVIFAGLLGISILYVNAWLVTWGGHLFDGTATRREVRAAIAWAEIPAITASAAIIVAMLAGLLSPPDLDVNGVPQLTQPTLELGGVHFVLGLWGFVVFLKCVGEVHRFSAWRALLAALIAAAVVAAVLIGGVWLMLSLTHAPHR